MKRYQYYLLTANNEHSCDAWVQIVKSKNKRIHEDARKWMHVVCKKFHAVATDIWGESGVFYMETYDENNLLQLHLLDYNLISKSTAKRLIELDLVSNAKKIAEVTEVDDSWVGSPMPHDELRYEECEKAWLAAQANMAECEKAWTATQANTEAQYT
jgi:hypothetical protein